MPGDLSVGQTFVLSIDAYAADPAVDPSRDWDEPENLSASRFGAATWIPMTDALGNATTSVDPFQYVSTTGGRDAADELLGTPYGRPEDIAIGLLSNGNEVVYVAITDETRVLSIELLNPLTAMVRVYVDFDTINLATGADVNPLENDPTAASSSDDGFEAPDNLDIDAFGDVYVLEDERPGDVWKIVDANRDGVGEAMGRLVSLGISGTEPSGFNCDPNDPYRFPHHGAASSQQQRRALGAPHPDPSPEPTTTSCCAAL